MGDGIWPCRLPADGEHPIAALPAGARGEPLLQLRPAPFAQGFDGRRGDGNHALAGAGLRRPFDDHAPVGGGAGAPDGGGAAVEVEVGPLEAAEFAAAHAGVDDEEPGGAPRLRLAAHGLENAGESVLLEPQLMRLDGRHLDGLCDGASDELEADGVVEGAAEDAVVAGNGGRREAFGEPAAVGGLDVGGPELLELEAPERRDKPALDAGPVALERRRPELWCALGEPLPQPLSDGDAARVDGEAGFVLMDELGEPRLRVALRAVERLGAAPPAPRHRVAVELDGDAPGEVAALLDAAAHGAPPPGGMAEAL
ncbi:hypothetical protein O0235_11525 [Tepidiforma flava]|uniref:Uncharacterized protein n=1 Tax=Tepidiforma flava TaxID=3004094 RepID=A0ABY7M516_9CHLR|nr:hypothetical protein [Tepidiforma flava]WBL35402.1 hypothetical protein O0235_11525 [Tepidiforma flava]